VVRRAVVRRPVPAPVRSDKAQATLAPMPLEKGAVSSLSRRGRSGRRQTLLALSRAD